MCLDKKEIKELMGAVAKVKNDTGNIRETQTELGKDLEKMEAHLKKLNSRTSKVEDKVDNLENAEIREARCIQKDMISEIKNSMLTVEKFEAWEQKKQREKEKEQAKKMHAELIAVQTLDARQRRMQWIISGIVGLGTIIMALISLL